MALRADESWYCGAGAGAKLADGIEVSYVQIDQGNSVNDFMNACRGKEFNLHGHKDRRILSPLRLRSSMFLPFVPD